MSDMVAQVWSFSNQHNDIPYYICRVKYSNKDESSRFRYTCSCPSFVNRGGKTSKHLQEMTKCVKDKSIINDRRFILTEFGIKILKL